MSIRLVRAGTRAHARVSRPQGLSMWHPGTTPTPTASRFTTVTRGPGVWHVLHEYDMTRDKAITACGRGISRAYAEVREIGGPLPPLPTAQHRICKRCVPQP